MSTFATIMGAAHNKNHNSFPAYGGKKVAHHSWRVFQNYALLYYKLGVKFKKTDVMHAYDAWFQIIFYIGLYL